MNRLEEMQEQFEGYHNKYPEHEGFFKIKKQTSVYKVANNWGDPTPEDV
tara:strand:- start:983 stop:1129 length:147 start_codon:yes stop_codon:yes gene_type:complete